MFGGRRYWQGNGGVYKGCCVPWDTWESVFPCHCVLEVISQGSQTDRYPAPALTATSGKPLHFSSAQSLSFSAKEEKHEGTFSFIFFFNLHLNYSINTNKKKQAPLYVDICNLCFLSAEAPSLTAQPPRKISADLDRNIDIPCQATGNALHTLFF